MERNGEREGEKHYSVGLALLEWIRRRLGVFLIESCTASQRRRFGCGVGKAGKRKSGVVQSEIGLAVTTETGERNWSWRR